MKQPTISRTQASNWSSDDVEAILDAFEVELDRRGSADLREFLPARESSAFLSVAVELIRIDLECSRARGVVKLIDEYRELAPSVFEDRASLGAIAFEEYRLRRLGGDPVELAEYIHRFSLDTSTWPQLSDGLSLRNGQRSIGGRTKHKLNALKSGDRFAGFELVELLGRGAFGVVFRARQLDLASREVVLKITLPRSVEPQRLARLQHTNIVPIYSVHEDSGLLGICMPFLGRHTLADLVRGGRPRPLDQGLISTVADQLAETETLEAAPSALESCAEIAPNNAVATSAPTVQWLDSQRAIDVIAQLAEGLAQAHERGIVHSDLKPANILVAEDGTPLLVDFNLAADSAATDRESLLVGGTLAYMAPEHLQAVAAGTPAPASGDIYSLGVIFYELLALERPFASYRDDFESSSAKLIVDRQQGAPSVRSRNSAVCQSIDSIIAKCLAPDIRGRYSRAHDLAEDLRRHQADLPLRHAVEPSSVVRCRKWLRRNARNLRVATLVALTTALFGSLALYSLRHARLLALEANAAYEAFERDFVAASLSLNTPGSELELYQRGRETAQAALTHFHLAEEQDPQKSALWPKLSEAQQGAVREQAVKLKYALAASPAEKERIFAQYEASSDLGTYLHAIDLLDKRESSAALKVLQGLRQRDPQDATIWLLLGNASYRAHRLVDAESCYTAVIALEPQAYTGYFYRGECRMDQDRFADAEQDFTAVLALCPDLPSGLLNRALVWRKLGALDRAERDATAAIDIGINDPRAYFVRALIREARGDLVGAKDDREHGYQLRPIDGKGWVALGMARLHDDPMQAREDFEQGLQENPKSPALLQNLIYLNGDRLQQPEIALPYANRLVEVCPDEPSAWSSRGVLRGRVGDFKGARQDAEQAGAGRIAPLTSLQLACVYALTMSDDPADADKAVLRLQNALSRDPQLASRAKADPDLTAIRARSDFQRLVAAAEQLSKPTSDSPREESSASSLDRLSE